MTDVRAKHWTTEPTDSIDIVIQKSGVGAWTPKTVIQVIIFFIFGPTFFKTELSNYQQGISRNSSKTRK